MIVYTIIFLLFAFFGWIIDSSYCSFVTKKLVISGYYKNLPFCPIYGFGGVLIMTSFIRFQSHSPLIIILLTTLAIVLLEYIGGWFCDKILKEKLWDYSDMKFNLNGYINLLHSVYWMILISIVFIIISPYIEDIENLIINMQSTFARYDLHFAVIFLASAFALTFNTRKRRLEIYLKRIEKSLFQ